MIEEFIWPSDQSRADDDELDRVCNHTEHLYDHIEELTEKVERLSKLLGH